MAYRTPPEVGKILGVNADRVRAWIMSEQLPAVNLGDGSRPRWRISDEGLAQFLRSRSSQAVLKAPESRRRKRKSAGVIEFFK